jgi:hypothetical protein
MHKKLIFLGLSPAICALFFGCNIEIIEDGEFDDFEETGSQEEQALAVCDPYCLELIECGALSESAFVSCRELCVKRFLEDETGVSEGCACVQAAACDGQAASACEGDPLPGILGDNSGGDQSGVPNVSSDDGTGSGSASGGAAADGGGDDSAVACSIHHDCASGEDCVAETCQLRCAASCQCDEGQACIEGYCAEPEAPAVTCQDDCDCTSGEQCTEGSCQ